MVLDAGPFICFLPPTRRQYGHPTKQVNGWRPHFARKPGLVKPLLLVYYLFNSLSLVHKATARCAVLLGASEGRGDVLGYALRFPSGRPARRRGQSPRLLRTEDCLFENKTKKELEDASMSGNAMRNGVTRIAGIALVVALMSLNCVWAQNGSPPNNILFTQQDQVQKFDVDFSTGAGTGYQIGTAKGKISGTTSVFFSVQLLKAPPGNLPFQFSNTVTITDLDGDQIYFLNEGTGSFHLADPNFVGSGGPLTGTYKVTGGTGKFASWHVGQTFRYRAIATNPPTNGFGTVYVEVYSNQDR